MHDPETHLIPLVLDVAEGRSAEARVFGDDYPTPDGTCVRDYIHVQDLANAHLLAIEQQGDSSRIYNLGSGGGYSVKEVIEMATKGRRPAARYPSQWHLAVPVTLPF